MFAPSFYKNKQKNGKTDHNTTLQSYKNKKVINTYICRTNNHKNNKLRVL